jgi:hypothetical protein
VNAKTQAEAPANTEAPKADKKSQINLRIPLDVRDAMDQFMANLTPTMRRIVDAASMTADGKPHPADHLAFMAYAIRLALAKADQAPRAFGTGIDKTFEEIVTRNLEAHEQRPDNWWELTAIGSSLLRDAGHNPVSVRRWIEENAERIAAHHAAVGITDPLNHNRKAGKAKKALKP